VIVGGVAMRYAKALFQLGIEGGNYRELLTELTDFSDFIGEREDVKDVLESSIYNMQEKRGILDTIILNNQYSEVLSKFLILLLEKGRIYFARQILKGFTALVEGHEGIERVTVTVATPLEAEQKEEIIGALKACSRQKILIEEQVDPSIMGGLIIKAGSRVFDGSIATQVTRLGEKLKKG